MSRTGSHRGAIDILDQTLLHIRNNLSNLSSDRMVMENKMEWLICEIQIVASDVHSFKNSQPKFQGITLRMVRSLTTPPRYSINLTDNKRDDNETSTFGLSHTSHKYSRSTIALPSESNLTTSSQFPHDGRNLSLLSRTKFRSQRSNSVEESQNHTTNIQEFPESPTFHSVPDNVLCSTASSKVYPTTYGTKITTYQKERYYSGTPPSWMSNRHTSMVTLVPSMSQCFTEDGEESITHPVGITSTRIPEEQIDGNISTSQQHGVYTESLSQQSSTSIRRSSSTRLPEHHQSRYQSQNMEVTPHGIHTENSSQLKTSIRRSSSTCQPEHYQTRYQGQKMEMTPHCIYTESSSQQNTSIRRSSSTRQPEHYQTCYQSQEMETIPHGVHTESLSQQSTSIRRRSSTHQPECYQTLYQHQEMEKTPHRVHTDSTSIRRSSSTRQPEHYQTCYQNQQIETTPHGVHTESSSHQSTSIRRSSSTRQPEHYQPSYRSQEMEMTPHAVHRERSSQQSNTLTRRSSWTSQREHYRTRYHVLQVDTTEEKLAECNKNDTSSFKVLNKGRKSIKRKLTQLAGIHVQVETPV